MESVVWTMARIERVKQLRSEHFTMSQISKILSDECQYHFTRNAIIGILRRVDCSGIDYKKIKKKKVIHSARMKQQVKNYKKDSAERDLLAPFQKYHGREIHFEKLEKNKCKFPLENGNSHVYCGDETIDHQSYCEHHYNICYQKTANAKNPYLKKWGIDWMDLVAKPHLEIPDPDVENC